MFPFKAIVVGVFCVYISKIERATSSPAEFPGKRQRGGDSEQDGWTSVLSSIESRLENLDSLYTSQLTPTIKTRLEHFQNRISGMELKLLRIEALLTTKLDRMSDNISSRHFRDDMAQTDLFRKIETAYDGITHRLAYMDRKSENSFLKIQGKTEIISKKLEDMDDTYTLKYDLLESELSDYGTGIDDLRTIFNISEQKLFNSFEKHTQDHLLKLKEMQLLSKKNISQELADTVHKIQENTTKSFDYLRRKMNTQISMSNSTGKTMQKFSEDLGRTLNEYASKVADLGAQVLKSDNKISTHLRIIETVSNSTRVELQNGLRALMVQVGKVSNNEDSQYEVVDQKLLSDMSQKLETNFGKIIDTQNSFLESCHRVQMDESQMETQISHILNKLIDNFSDTTKEQHYLQKKMENLLIKHDVQFKKEMYQANTNILATFDHTKKNFKVMNEKLKKSEENLEALFSLMQNVVGGSPVNWKRGNVNEKGLREHIQKLEDALNFTKIEQLAMFDSYRATIETLLTMTESRNNEEKNMHLLMKNITGNILNVKEKLQNLSMDLNTNDTRDIIKSVENVYKLVKENNDNLVRVLKSYENGTIASENKPKGRSVKVEKPKDNRNITNNENAGNQSDIDELIRKVFFINTTTTTEKTEVSCLDFDIDVRFESGTRYEKCGNQSKKAESIVESAETGNPIDQMMIQVLMEKNTKQQKKLLIRRQHKIKLLKQIQ
ncbi:hypothetical protein WA026_003463 [Henosepilachna vigintioctopunctata]|uniref:Paramyosin n=1 Tax=Henosepilachna vigintioctopunctata TaxID=420089 RepID=A0AAW1THJ0_9CUCU